MEVELEVIEIVKGVEIETVYVTFRPGLAASGHGAVQLGGGQDGQVAGAFGWGVKQVQRTKTAVFLAKTSCHTFTI